MEATWSTHLRASRLPIAFSLAVQAFELVFLPIPSEASALDRAFSGAPAKAVDIALALVPVLLAAFWPAACVIWLRVPLRVCTKPPSPALRRTGACVLICATLASISSVLSLRACVETGTLCTSGLFAFSRNPINVSIVGCALATAILVPGIPNLAGTLLISLHLNAKTVIEERRLAAVFGESWEAYSTHTPQWLSIQVAAGIALAALVLARCALAPSSSIDAAGHRGHRRRWCSVCGASVGIPVVLAASCAIVSEPAPTSSVAPSTQGTDDGVAWLEHKYEYLSRLVPMTNWFRFGDATASLTMHAMLWNGSAWDIQLSNRMVADATLDILLRRDALLAPLSPSVPVRVLDAGSGWGGTTFYLEGRRQAAIQEAAILGDRSAESARGRAQEAAPIPLVRYDGLTLAPTQAHAANATAAVRQLGSVARFYVGSFEESLPSAPYDAILAIESMEHASNMGSCLAHFAEGLRAGGALVILTDVLLDQSKRDSSLLVREFREHWCGPHTRAWRPPATKSEWEEELKRAGLRLTSATDLSAKLYQRPFWALSTYFRALLLVHRLSTALGLVGLSFQSSTQIGGVARELLLHHSTIGYTFMVARRVV